MAVNIIQSSFAGGEWAPSLHNRTDLERYRTAVRTMKNFIINPHGYIKNRPGTYFITETKDSSKKSRLIPFQFSAGDAYVLEVGHNYIRILQAGGIIDPGPGSGTDIIDSAVYKWTDSGVALWGYYLELLAGGDPGLGQPLKVYEDVGGTDNLLTYINACIGLVPNLLPGQWSYHDMNGGIGFDTIFMRITDDVDPDTKADGYCEGMYGYEIVTTYDEDDIFDIQFIQRGDVMYLVHPTYPVKTLTRTSSTSWTFASASFGASISAPANFARDAGAGTGNNYTVTAVNADEEESVGATALTNNGPGDTWTWDAATGAVYYNIYKDPYGSGLYGWIGRATNLTFKEIAAGIDPDFSKGTPQAQTVFNAVDAYPGAVSFFQQRLCFARSNDYPQTIWGSVIAKYTNFNHQIPLQDNDAFIFALTEINQIRWIAALRDLIIGTAGGEWRMSPAIDETTITPTNVIVIKESSWGCALIHPVLIGNDLLFVDATQKVIRDFKGTVSMEGTEEYRGNNLCILASHLFDNYTIEDWSYQQNPDSVIWVIRNDGTLLGLTYFKEQAVLGWHQHETDGTFESVCSILKSNGVYETYVIVNRTINSSTVRYVEYFTERLPVNDSYENEIEDSFFVDCGLSYDSPVDITAATKANPVQVTAADHGLSTDDYIDITEVLGMTELNGNRYKVVRIDADNITLKDTDGDPIDGTGYTTYISGGKLRKAVTNITGLGHLEGESVAVLADGISITGKTVSSGAIALTTAASRVHVGLAYESILETLDINYDTREGTTQGKIGDISSVFLRLINTASLQVGPDEDNLSEIDFEDAEFYSDDKEVFILPNEYGKCRIYCKVTEPLPCQINAIISRVEHADY